MEEKVVCSLCYSTPVISEYIGLKDKTISLCSKCLWDKHLQIKDDDPKKVCVKCGKVLPINKFMIKKIKDGSFSRFKMCGDCIHNKRNETQEKPKEKPEEKHEEKTMECVKCNETKPLDNFYINERVGDTIKYRHVCKKCCYLRQGYEKRSKGLDKIDKQTINTIASLMKDHKIADMARLTGLRYNKVYYIVHLLKEQQVS